MGARVTSQFRTRTHVHNQGYELEAAMGASSAAGTPSSFLSASQSAVPLHRAVFVEYGGMVRRTRVLV